MNVKQLDISRRTIAVAAALIGTVSLVIGAHAALNMRALDAAKAVSTEPDHRLDRPVPRASRWSSATAIIPTPARR